MQRGLGLILLGPPGVGKTSFCLQAPKPVLCISIFDQGYHDLEAVGDVPQGCVNVDVTSYEGLLQCLKAPDFKTYIIDGLAGFQQILFNHLIKILYNGDKQKFSAYFTGPRTDAPAYMADLLVLLNNMLIQGKNLFVIAHRVVDSKENPVGPDVVSYVMDLDKGIRAKWEAWAPNILMLGQAVDISSVTKATKQQDILEGKARSTDTRIMYTALSPATPCKNKLKLPPYIPMGNSPQESWEAFWKHVPDVYKT